LRQIKGLESSVIGNLRHAYSQCQTLLAVVCPRRLRSGSLLRSAGEDVSSVRYQS